MPEISVKNLWLKSRASNSPSSFSNLATRLHLPFCLLSCFICPMHCLPAVSYSDSLSVSLRWQSYYGAGFFKWTFTTASTLPRGTAALSSGFFRFRSACLHVAGFTRCWVNSYFWRISLKICLLQGDRWYRELRSRVPDAGGVSDSNARVQLFQDRRTTKIGRGFPARR